MSEVQKHSLSTKDLVGFHEELSALLSKYSVHPEGSIIELKTQNLRFKSMDIRNCRPECIRTAEVCDRDGKHCHVEVWCECDDVDSII